MPDRSERRHAWEATRGITLLLTIAAVIVLGAVVIAALLTLVMS